MGMPTLHASRRTSEVAVPAVTAWAVVASGRRGPRWYVEAAPFVLRGAIDRLAGGAGRRWEPPGTPLLGAGDTGGFWRVLEAETHDGTPDPTSTGHHDGAYGGGRLLLEAAVRAPGRVLLETLVEPVGAGRARIAQEVRFEPAGIVGRAYLLADLPAREAVIDLTHRRLLSDLRRETA